MTSLTETLLNLLVCPVATSPADGEDPWGNIDPPSAIQLFVKFLVCLQRDNSFAFTDSPNPVCQALNNQHPDLFQYDSWRKPFVRSAASRILGVFLTRTESIDTVTLSDFLQAVLTKPVIDKKGGLPFITKWNNMSWSWFVHRDSLWYSVLNHYTLSAAEELRLRELDPMVAPVAAGGAYNPVVLGGAARTQLQQQWLRLVDLLWEMIPPNYDKNRKGDVHRVVRDILEGFLLEVYETHHVRPSGVDTVESLLHSAVGYLGSPR